ncbi:TPA: acyltransferase, partial [Pseudomonas aeruginosa]|nr:acyltransferase [Pseudomonas aeruginosa]
NDPVFRQYVQEWVSRMWKEKDERIARLRQLR